jgi:hypothetical protein
MIRMCLGVMQGSIAISGRYAQLTTRLCYCLLNCKPAFLALRSFISTQSLGHLEYTLLVAYTAFRFRHSSFISIVTTRSIARTSQLTLLFAACIHHAV